MKRKLNIVIAAAALAAPAATAATVTYNDSKPVIEVTGPLLGSNILNLPKFDTMGGTLTLTGVQITVTLSVPSFTMVVDNDTTQTASGGVGFGTLGSALFSSSASTLDGSFTTLSGSNFSVATQSDTFTVFANDSDATDSHQNDSGPDNFSFTTNAVLVGQTTSRDISSLVWGQWTGAGNVALDLGIDFAADMNLNSSGGTGVVRYEGVIPTATYSASVTYSYVPEPSAALLGGLGLLGLLRRRR